MKKLAVVVLALAAVGCVSESSLRVQANQQFQEMRRQMPISQDPAERAYIFCVAQSVLRVVEEPYASQAWEVEVFNKPDANAFAMPGGKIGVNNGILKVARNQDQLAAVIGHEIAHVTREHQVAQVNRGMATSGVAAIAGAAAGLPPQDVQTMAQIGLTLPFSRKHEREADDIGLLYMADAGFDPRASVELWKNMDDVGGARPPQFLSTHPAPEDRMGNLIARMSDALQRYNLARARGVRPVCE